MTLNAYLDGPYGAALDFRHHDTVVLVAGTSVSRGLTRQLTSTGGTGITFVLSHFLELLSSLSTRPDQKLHLVWNVRHTAHIQWIAPLLNQAFTRAIEADKGETMSSEKHGRQCESDGQVRIDIYVTKSYVADEPGTHVVEGVEKALPLGHLGVHEGESSAHDATDTLGPTGRSDSERSGGASSGTGSGSASFDDSMDEKEGKSQGYAEHGLSAAASRHVKVHHARAPLRDILDAVTGDVGVVGEYFL
jgi:hypothetical protein